MDGLIRECIYFLQYHSSAEALTLWTFALCAISILALLRFYQLPGLYLYNALAIIFANIQVLRFTEFTYFSEPVALGTVLFTTTFFVNDLISEHYGLEAARRSVSLGFWAQVLSTLWMILALGHPLPDLNKASVAVIDAQESYNAMLQIFSPSMRILLASLISYYCSQWLDILIFNRIRTITAGKYLWLRQNFAMFISGIFDNFLFSALAWMLMSSTPISVNELIFTYVLSSQVMRLMLNLSFTPLMYMSYSCVTKTKIRIHDIKERPASI